MQDYVKDTKPSLFLEEGQGKLITVSLSIKTIRMQMIHSLSRTCQTNDAMSPAGLKILRPCLSESGRNSVQGFIHQPTIPFFKQSIEEYIQQSILRSQHYEYITNS